MGTAIAPQIITAVATLGGVALTLGANTLSEKRKNRRDDERRFHAEIVTRCAVILSKADTIYLLPSRYLDANVDELLSVSRTVEELSLFASRNVSVLGGDVASKLVLLAEAARLEDKEAIEAAKTATAEAIDRFRAGARSELRIK